VTFDFLIGVGFWGLITGRSVDDLFALGVPSLQSVSICIVSLAFPAAVTASLYTLYHHRHAVINRWVYWHSAAIAVALLAVAIYYACWGLIGLRLWA